MITEEKVSVEVLVDMIIKDLILQREKVKDLSADNMALATKLAKLEERVNKLNSVRIYDDNSIIATIKNVYQLDDYPYKDKILTVYMIDFEEFTERLYLHRVKDNFDGLQSGCKATFKVEGDRIKDFKSIKNIT